MFINESRNAIENAPKSAEYIREPGPPFIFIPPNTRAISIFIPTEDPEDADKVGVSTIIANEARPIPIPARANDITVNVFGLIPESRAQNGLPPKNFCFLPILSK